MIQSYIGLEFLKDLEFCKLNAYLDEAGVATIGYGSTRYEDGKKVKLGDKISQEIADNLLALECDGIVSRLQQIVNKELNQNQIDSLVSFCYNVGVQGFKTSSLLKAINLGGVVTKDLFTRWDKYHKDGMLLESKGLKVRRVKEFNLFTKPME